MTYIFPRIGFMAGRHVRTERTAAVSDRGFRDDINALRGIAALIVVLFHFGVGGFGGGFAGVDVFFVISGLLMSGIIERGVERGRFSVLGFYAARVRRIVPALMVLCLTLVLMGAILLDPVTLAEVARNATASLLFLSNMLYASTSSYFAESAESNWLLHTWTLSVEWQFYMVYPVVLAVVARWRWLWERRAMVVAIACLASFAATVVLAGRSESFEKYAFFLLPTRAWEMLAGGWLAFAAPQIRSRLAGDALILGGLAAILFSTLALDSAVPWPSLWTAIPVLGTVAILSVARSGAAWAHAPGLQRLGTWSYSLYLLHWPVVAGLHYYGVPMDGWTIAIGLLVSLVLAALSFELVESRLRNAIFGRNGTQAWRWTAIAVGAALLVALPVAAWRSQGFEAVRTAHFDAQTRQRLADYRGAPADWQGMAPCNGQRYLSGHMCVMGAGQPNRVAVIGDSHAEQMLPRFAMLARTRPVEITMFRQQGCAPLPELLWTNSGAHCRNFTEDVFRRVGQEHYPRVVIIGAWAHYFAYPDGVRPGALCAESWRGCRPLTAEQARRDVDRAFATFSDRVRALVDGGALVTVVLQGPDPGEIKPHDYYRRTFFDGAPAMAQDIDRARYEARTARVRAMVIAAAKRGGAQILDPLDSRCGEASCPVFREGEYLFTDSHHTRASAVTQADFAYMDRALMP